MLHQNINRIQETLEIWNKKKICECIALKYDEKKKTFNINTNFSKLTYETAINKKKHINENKSGERKKKQQWKHMNAQENRKYTTKTHKIP